MAEQGLGFSAPGESLQRTARSWRLFTDQHGRSFGAQVENTNGMPVGELTPQGFSPPWQPNMWFAKFPGNHSLTFRWDYKEMADWLSERTATYYQDAIKFAIENNKPEPEIGGPVDRSIRYVLGIPGAEVNATLKLVLEQTAGANQKEALDVIMARLRAQVTDSNVAMVPSVPVVAKTKEVERTINDTTPFNIEQVTYPEFLKACAGRKMTLGEIAAAWSEHKKAMSEAVAA